MNADAAKARVVDQHIHLQTSGDDILVEFQGCARNGEVGREDMRRDFMCRFQLRLKRVERFDTSCG